jgi:hypothetical protein
MTEPKTDPKTETEPEPKPEPKPTRKSRKTEEVAPDPAFLQVVADTKAGRYGYGNDTKVNLELAGYDYERVMETIDKE